MGNEDLHSTIFVVFRPVGTHGEADIKMRCPVDEPVMVVSVFGHTDGPEGQHVVIEYGPDNRPPEVWANDMRAQQQREREIRESERRSIFRLFTDQARRVMIVAQEEARRLGYNQIGTEHILLAIIGTGATAELEALGVSPDGLRDDVLRIVKPTGEPTFGHIPFTPRAKRSLDLAAEEARMLTPPPQPDFSISTGHLLLGLIHEGKGIAANVLERRGVTIEAMRAQVEARRI